MALVATSSIWICGQAWASRAISGGSNTVATGWLAVSRTVPATVVWLACRLRSSAAASSAMRRAWGSRLRALSVARRPRAVRSNSTMPH